MKDVGFFIPETMKREFYLIIEGKKSRWATGKVSDFSVRVNKSKPSLNSDEIAVLLNIEVPVEFFERMTPVVNLSLPKDAILTLSEETVIALSAPELAQKLKISLEDAEDGLKQMLSKKENLQ